MLSPIAILWVILDVFVNITEFRPGEATAPISSWDLVFSKQLPLDHHRITPVKTSSAYICREIRYCILAKRNGRGRCGKSKGQCLS